jgi:2-dehydropantoate 2-reductase
MNSVAIMGAGAVGGFYGALLAQSGRPVAFIARGDHLAAIRRSGLTVERDGQAPLVVRGSAATDDPAEVGPVDLVLFTPKAMDLEDAAARMKPLLGQDTVVLPLLNGLDAVDRLAAVVGRQHVLAGSCQIVSTIASPGVIRQRGSLNRIVLGEAGARARARRRRFACSRGPAFPPCCPSACSTSCGGSSTSSSRWRARAD